MDEARIAIGNPEKGKDAIKEDTEDTEEIEEIEEI